MSLNTKGMFPSHHVLFLTTYLTPFAGLDKVDASLSSLRLNLTSSTEKPSPKKFQDEEDAPDSWEEAASDDGSSPIPIPSHKRVDSTNVPNPPPPTPISPPQGNFFPPPPSNSIADRFASGGFSAAGERASSSGLGRSGSGRDTERRQEKTDAVAKRLIAGALGIKAPKKTDEQRAYDRAIREKEMRRRNEEVEKKKREEEEREKLKAAVWED